MEETAAKTAMSSKERVRKHREALRASGLRPVTRWVPDLRDPDFAARYKLQRGIIADSITPDRELEMEFWESIQCDEGWV